MLDKILFFVFCFLAIAGVVFISTVIWVIIDKHNEDKGRQNVNQAKNEIEKRKREYHETLNEQKDRIAKMVDIAYKYPTGATVEIEVLRDIVRKAVSMDNKDYTYSPGNVLYFMECAIDKAYKHKVEMEVADEGK